MDLNLNKKRKNSFDLQIEMDSYKVIIYKIIVNTNKESPRRYISYINI